MDDDSVRSPTGDSSVDLEDMRLFREFAQNRSRRLRNQLVERHMGLAAHIAKRYAKAGPDDDVRQVAMLGLVKSVDRFDPEYGASFGSFAGRTIEGEIKRFFRDKSWIVRVPRSAKELHLAVRRATDELSHDLGRAPTVDEIAEHLHIDRDDVAVGLSATAAYHPGSLDSFAGDSDDDAVPSDRSQALADDDRGFDDTIDRHLVDELLAGLPDREREIVELRFYEEKSQSEIAELVGMSQMHVSRLLRRSYEQMRSILAES